MDKELLLEMEKELNHAANCTIQEFEDFGLRVDVKLIEDYRINASVGKVTNKDKTYCIQINTGVIESLKSALVEKYMVDFSEKDFLQYQFLSSDSLHNHFDDQTLKNSFFELVIRFVCYNILFHECGHILLGHCDRRKIRIAEQSEHGVMQGGYGLQAREMLADWYGIEKAMNVFLFSFAQTCKYRITDDNDLLIIQKALFLAIVALYCQFDLFEAASVCDGDDSACDACNACDRSEYSECKLKYRTHPHPYIRLVYGCDAIKEATMGVLEYCNSVDSNTSERVVTELIHALNKDFLLFFEKMGLNHVKFDIFRQELIECHYLIRKKAASKRHSTKPYVVIPMEKIPREYLTFLRELKSQ